MPETENRRCGETSPCATGKSPPSERIWAAAPTWCWRQTGWPYRPGLSTCIPIPIPTCSMRPRATAAFSRASPARWAATAAIAPSPGTRPGRTRKAFSSLWTSRASASTTRRWWDTETSAKPLWDRITSWHRTTSWSKCATCWTSSCRKAAWAFPTAWNMPPAAIATRGK